MQPGDLIEYKLGNHHASRGVIVRPVTDRDGRAGLMSDGRPACWVAWFGGGPQTWAFEADLTLISKLNV